MMIFGNTDLTEFGINTWLRDDGVEKLNINGKVYDNKETILDLTAVFTDFNLAPLAPLGNGVISNIRGTVSYTHLTLPTICSV